MGSIGKLEVEVEVKSEASKLWQSIRDATTVFPKALPDLYKSVEVLEGDGISVGSVRLMHYVEGEAIVPSSKEKIEVVDEENKTFGYTILGGEIEKYYKNFKASVIVTPKGDGDGSLVKWCCEFQKASEDVPDPNIIRDFAAKNFKELDAYILKA